GIVDGQTTEQVRVRGYQRFHLRYRGVEVLGDLRRVLGATGLSRVAGPCWIVVRCGVFRRFSGSRGLRRFGWLARRRRIRQHRIGADGIDDTEMTDAERLLYAGHAA